MAFKVKADFYFGEDRFGRGLVLKSDNGHVELKLKDGQKVHVLTEEELLAFRSVTSLVAEWVIPAEISRLGPKLKLAREALTRLLANMLP